MDEKKPRSDSKLDGLSSGQRAELVRLLADGCKYQDALEWLSAECRVTSTLSALSAFYKRHVVPILKERREFAAARAEAIVSEAGAIDWDLASVELLKGMAFRELNRESADAETVERLMKLIFKNREQVQNERKLVVLERKAELADAAQKVSGNESLSAAEKAAKLKEIFGS